MSTWEQQQRRTIASLLSLAICSFFSLQVANAQYPLGTVDLLAGAAAHNRFAGTTEYRSTPVFISRASLTLRLATFGDLSPIARLELEPRGFIESSTGAPGPYAYPPVGGTSVAAGVAHASRTGHVGWALVAGGGRYGGTYRGIRHASLFAEGEIAWRLAGHLGVLGNLQCRQWTDGGSRHWIAPVAVGVRLF